VTPQTLPKPLVIVESPAKAKTIGKFLGNAYTVKASMGHVRDLPRSGLHVYPEKNFEADWEPIKERAKVVADLRKHLQDADTLYLATDPDREGEAIAWHLAELLAGGKKAHDIKRVVFHEITKEAIREAFEHPGHVNEALVDAYRARRILDRLVGYQLSELLWKKLTRGLSAGRVQSVAVKLVVDREREIRAFVPEEYWRVLAHFEGEGEAKGQAFTAEFKKLDGKGKELKSKADADEVMKRAQGGPFTLSSLKQQPRRVSAKPPFKTSTLQQAAAGRYGFTAKRTMRIAQNLYEGIELPGEGAVGLITYMRTDSFNIAGAARESARELIRQRFGEKFLPEKPNAYRSKEGAQEAHEAIRPTDPKRTPESVRRALSEEQWKLYDLIWRRFIACQMAPAEYLVTTLELTRNGALFTASGRVTTFPGFTQVYGADLDEEQRLPTLTEGQQLTPSKVVPSQHFTTPPRRYTEASLVKALEEFGIGRPSTYASILSTIVDRKYVDHGEEQEQEKLRQQMLHPDQVPASAEAEEESEDGAPREEVPAESDDEEAFVAPRQRRKNAFFATHLGEVTTDLLEPQFGDIVNTAFTAQFETDLDRIAEGDMRWQKVVEGFYDRFKADLEQAKGGMQHYRSRPLQVPDMTCNRVDEKTGEVCGAPMVVLFNRGGAYLGCSRYPDCSNNLPLSGQRNQTAELTEFTCRARDESGKICGRPMERKVNRWGRPFLACTGFKTKECKGAVSVSTKGEPLWPVETTVPCPQCGRMLSIKRSRRGKFLACPGYPKCRGTLNLPTCTHVSRGGTECGLAMTEPGPDGTLLCKEHPEVALPPPPPRVRKDEGDEAGAEPAGAAAAAPAAGAKSAKRAPRKTAKSARKP
jgi:DNA topoisomerase-1